MDPIGEVRLSEVLVAIGRRLALRHVLVTRLVHLAAVNGRAPYANSVVGLTTRSFHLGARV